VAADGRAVLVLDGIDPAPTGKTYELWVLEGDVAVPAGLFPGSEGTEIVGLGRPVDEGNRVAVTLEDEGGVDEPTLPPIAASEPV
jgi:anti-sigma-K factor RskA